jgi:hypothetical protein
MDLRKAAEMALEALEWNYGTDLENIENCMVWLDKMNATIPALRQALAQPEQEQYVTKVVAVHEDGTYTTERIPLPKREWVGLTEDEKQFFKAMGFSGIDIVEAKLKERNT